MNEAGRVDRMENASLLFTAGTHSSIIVHKVSSGKLVFTMNPSKTIILPVFKTGA